jgi:hypothetical protein
MAYFAIALLCLLGAQLMMVAGCGFPSAAIEDPQTLILMHLVTIGWLSLLMCGALIQFVPVLVSQPLRWPKLVLPALVSLVCGLASLLAGFLQLSGLLVTDIAFLPLAAVLLPAGFGLVIAVLGRTLWSGRPLPLPARFVAAGLVCLIAAASIGGMFAVLLSGFAPVSTLIDWRQQILPMHISAGFGGWLTLTAIGVSYRLLPMFMLSPDKERWTGRAALWSGCTAMALVLIAVPLEDLLGRPGGAWAAACLAMLVSTTFYGADLVFFYRHRKRRNVELNSRSAVGAFAALGLSCGLLAVLAVTGTLNQNIGALVYLVAFGWLSGLGLSQLYKIVPFLTWLECYGPVMGRKPTPRVQDLVVERRDVQWFALYFAGVLVGTAALLAGTPGLFRLAALATLCATVALGVEMVLVRRLFNVAAAARLPEGTAMPRLFLSSSR